MATKKKTGCRWGGELFGLLYAAVYPLHIIYLDLYSYFPLDG